MTRARALRVSLIRKWRGVRLAGFAGRPIPHHLDDPFDELAEAFLRALPRSRASDIMAALPAKVADGLLVYAERMASLAVRTVQPSLLKKALVAVVLSSSTVDLRECLIVGCLLPHAARTLRRDPKHLLSGPLASLRHIDTAKLILKQLEDPPMIRAMGYRESEDRDGFRYVWDPSVLVSHPTRRRPGAKSRRI